MTAFAEGVLLLAAVVSTLALVGIRCELTKIREHLQQRDGAQARPAEDAK